MILLDVQSAAESAARADHDTFMRIKVGDALVFMYLKAALRPLAPVSCPRFRQIPQKVGAMSYMPAHGRVAESRKTAS